MSYILNWRRQPIDERDIVSQRYKTVTGPFPDTGFLPIKIPVYDQMNAGSCTANGGSTAFRFEWYQLKNNFEFDPSRLFIYYNTRELEGTANEDSGCYVRDVFKVMNKFGACDDSLWPYSNYEQTLLVKPPVNCYTQGLNQLVVKYAAVPKSVSTIKQTILSGAAIIFGFDVYSSFFGDWKSIMPIPKNGESFEGGHAVTIVGYDDIKQSVLIQNSWGIGWKDNGYFWMPYSYLVSSHSDDFWCIEEIKLNEEVLPNDNKELIKSIFKSKKELSSLKETVLLRIGTLLNVPVDQKFSKVKNIDIISKELF